MRRSADFDAAVRRGARAGRTTLVVHCLSVPGRDGTRVGMVVARGVGGAVVRNKVRRRLRGVVVEQRSALPDGADVVVRALPLAATATYAALSTDFGSALAVAATRSRGNGHGSAGAGDRGAGAEGPVGHR
jgi:ribonuclease P protein component